ncbi:MAG: hypothetical protein MJ025_04150 [Victivallaceae bacterium]|nr:hypothetical protein [Victivallaceae bacterium]
MRILVSAGPTRERIDAVRFITNGSSGRMGYAIAIAAKHRGHDVVLVSGPVHIPAPQGVTLVNINSAKEMADAVLSAAPAADIVIMSAAVADYTIANPEKSKIKKRDGSLVLELVRTTDILAELGRRKKISQTLVGFAAETDDLLENAKSKLRRKNLDFVVANLVSDGFGGETDKVVVISSNGDETPIGPARKEEIADLLLDLVISSHKA